MSGTRGLLGVKHLLPAVASAPFAEVVVELQLTAIGTDVYGSLELESVVRTTHSLAAL
jgi:hypothetical protein